MLKSRPVPAGERARLRCAAVGRCSVFVKWSWGLAVSYFLFMWMIVPFMSSVKPKGGYANKILGSGLPGVHWPYIEGR